MPKSKNSEECIEFPVNLKMSEAACVELRSQKAELVEALNRGQLTEQILGIVHLLDHIQDTMVDGGHFPEEIVFNTKEDTDE